MNDHLSSLIRQHHTHYWLAGQSGAGAARNGELGLDAIIVPASRPATNLDHAVTLARAAHCQLVILCSQGLRSADVQEFLADRSFRGAIVIDIPAGYSHDLLHFRELLTISAELPPQCGFYVTDLSIKRNIGLVLAKMLGWQRIFFLDDDIRDIAFPDLQTTVDMLGSFSAAGMRVTDFPDNSIACHASRMTGGFQDVFISGAALAVNCEESVGFFPDVYNEDWFFFFDAASEGQLGSSYCEATQLVYYPFADAQRAAWQEFGDVLAEGLYALLHLDLDIGQATTEYWTVFLDARRHFLETTLSRADGAQPDMRDEIITSLQSALKCLSGITPDLCARYVRLWRQDLVAWKRRMAVIHAMPSVNAALAELELKTAPIDRAKRIRRGLRPQDKATSAGPVSLPKFDTLSETAERLAAPRPGVSDSNTPQPDMGSKIHWKHLWQRGI
jgi:hypothetical protein